MNSKIAIFLASVIGLGSLSVSANAHDTNDRKSYKKHHNHSYYKKEFRKKKHRHHNHHYYDYRHYNGPRHSQARVVANVSPGVDVVVSLPLLLDLAHKHKKHHHRH